MPLFMVVLMKRYKDINWINCKVNAKENSIHFKPGKRLLQVCKKPVETGRVVENLTGTLHLCRVINNLKQS